MQSAWTEFHEGSRKKIFFSGPATKRGLGGKGLVTKKKELFKGLKDKALVAGPIKINFFATSPRSLKGLKEFKAIEVLK